jgi:predicted benzoate:H+ symporter BenE
MNKLKAINSVQFSIQLITALLLLYFALKSDTPDRAIIPILLLLGWSLGFYQRRVTRRRVNKLRDSKNKDVLHEG